MNRIDALTLDRTGMRLSLAREIVAGILSDARDKGVSIAVVGSLARDDFMLHSDIDLIVRGETCPSRRAMVERLVADRLRGKGIPYDLIFESDITAERAREILDACV